jgi:hypothetical protein
VEQGRLKGVKFDEIGRGGSKRFGKRPDRFQSDAEPAGLDPADEWPPDVRRPGQLLLSHTPLAAEAADVLGKPRAQGCAKIALGRSTPHGFSFRLASGTKSGAVDAYLRDLRPSWSCASQRKLDIVRCTRLGSRNAVGRHP